MVLREQATVMAPVVPVVPVVPVDMADYSVSAAAAVVVVEPGFPVVGMAKRETAARVPVPRFPQILRGKPFRCLPGEAAAVVLSVVSHHLMNQQMVRFIFMAATAAVVVPVVDSVAAAVPAGDMVEPKVVHIIQ